MHHVDLFSCVKEECCQLCVECDRVFHKAVAKRHHIRIPVVVYNEEAQQLQLETLLRMMPGPISTVTKSLLSLGRWLTLQGLASILASIRELMDDRTVSSIISYFKLYLIFIFDLSRLVIRVVLTI